MTKSAKAIAFGVLYVLGIVVTGGAFMSGSLWGWVVTFAALFGIVYLYVKVERAPVVDDE